MPAKRYVALLRGINVGGKNRVAMADLRQTFLAGGFENVSTYIQSGNVLFESDAPSATVEANIEAMLARELQLPILVVVRSFAQMRNAVEKAPDGFGTEPDRYHSDVVFLKAPLTPKRMMRVIELRDGVDRVWTGTGLVYFQRLSVRRSQSRMSRIISVPEYARLTIRNWNTTTRLLELLETC
jgi:uncharacterized protein (DUF1697 family)